MVSKLLKLKEWLTVEEAAKRLAITVGEEVTEADVLRLALDGHLTISVYFVNHASARRGKFVPLEETEWFFSPPLFPIPSSVPLTDEKVSQYPAHLRHLWNKTPVDQRKDCVPLLASLATADNRFINLEKEVTTLTGVWDLPLIGAEAIDLEHAYQCLTGGPEVTLEGLDGAFVSQGQEAVCQLQQSWDENPYDKGSLASLRRLKAFIQEKEITAEKAEKLLAKHEEDRATFLRKQRERPNSERYYPAGGLPQDSVLVVRTSALRELEEKLLADDSQPEKHAEQVAAETKPSHFLAIAALLELLKAPVERPRPQGMNQEAIKAAILERFPWRGLSDRNLQTIFAAANKAKADAE